jgi:hypothetical protein
MLGSDQPSAIFAVSSGTGFHIQGCLKGLPRRSPLGVSATHPNPVWHSKESSLRPPVHPSQADAQAIADKLDELINTLGACDTDCTDLRELGPGN